MICDLLPTKPIPYRQFGKSRREIIRQLGAGVARNAMMTDRVEARRQFFHAISASPCCGKREGPCASLPPVREINASLVVGSSPG